MKIKIIDLFNKIAKEEAPEKIMYDGDIWNFDGSVQDYSDGTKYLFADYMSDFAYKPEFLNDEVEIIEEEKEIEKIGKIYDGFTDSYYDTCLETTIKKVDEIIDEINKLKKKYLNIDNKTTCYAKYSDYKNMVQSYEDKLKQCKKEVIEDTSNISVGSIITYNGFEWYIIEKKENSVVLFMKEKLSEELIYDVRFSKDEKNNDWKDSHIRQVLNTKFLEKFITGDLVLMKTKYDDDKTSDDYIRLITIDELKKLDSNIRKVKCNYGCWTMSPGNFNSGLAEVYEFYLSGTYIATYSSLVTGRSGVRPIIEVRKNAIGG